MEKQVKRNPSRNNKNINQGQSHEKRLDTEHNQDRNTKIHSTTYHQNENILDGSRVPDSSGDELDNPKDRPSHNQKQKKTIGNQQAESQAFQKSLKPQGPQRERETEHDMKYDNVKKFDEDQDYGGQQDDSKSQ